MKWLKYMTVGLVTSCTLMACGEPASDNNSTTNNQACVGKCDTNEGKPACSKLVVSHRGDKLSDGEIKGLDDPLARYVLRRGDECPTNFDTVMDKLRIEDANGCDVEDRKAGIQAAVVSETAQLLDKPTNYRVVVTRSCKDEKDDDKKRKQEDLMFSLFGVRAGAETINPNGVEVMAFDKAAGVYNYYVLEGDQISFQGNSIDMVNQTGGRCAGCHRMGGPVMKELDTPWVHWEGHLDIPGSKELVSAHDNFGTKFTGSTMERITESGIKRTNEMVLAHNATERTARDLLRPLFCSVDVNVDNGRDFKDSGSFKVGKDFLLDAQFASFGSVGVDLEVYKTAIKELDQFVSLDGANPATDAEGEIIRDTVFAFSYLERSFSENDYIKKMKENKILDDDFIFDTLAVDFTRPLLSSARCGLLDHVPAEMEGKDVSPESIKEAMIKSLDETEERTAFEEAFLTNLQTAEDTDTHKEVTKAFVDACDEREEKDFIVDVIKYATVVRRHFTDHSNFDLFEFAPGLAMAEFDVSPDAFLDPETCILNESE